MKVNLDLVNQTNASIGHNSMNVCHNQSFTGAAPAAAVKAAEELTDSARTREVTKAFIKGLPQAGAINMMKKLEWLKGEIGGIIITAIGTGTVAPIFIAFNPFAKAPKNATPEEKKKNTETKEYTAMRQPISAALAILFQASVQKYIDKGLDAFLNNPKYAKYVRPDEDHTILNTDTYIKAKVRKKFKEDNIKKPSILKYFTGDKTEYHGEMLRQRTLYDTKFNDAVDAEKDAQIKKLAELMEENAGKSEVKGLIPLASGEYWSNKDVAEIFNKQVENYRKETKSLIKTSDEINVKVDRAKVLIENEDYLRKLFTGIPGVNTADKKYTYKEILQKGPETTKAVQEALAKVEKDASLGVEQKKQIKVLLQEILDRPEDLRANRIERTLWRIDNIKDMCGGKDKFTPDLYREKMLKKNSILNKMETVLGSLKIKDPAKASKEDIANAIDAVAEQCRFERKGPNGKIIAAILEGADTFGEDKGKLVKKIYKDIANGVGKVMKNSHTSWSQFIKIAVGVCVTLPITCTALNWVYPRFMEIFFPKLAGVKKDPQPQKTGGDK